MNMCAEEGGAVAVAGVEAAEVLEGEVVEKEKESDEGKILVFGLNLKDPQDLITIGLSGLIIYNTIDLAVYFAMKLINGS
jgi:hypothetical protein